MQSSATFASAQKTATILWLALGFAVVIYGFVLWYMDQNTWHGMVTEVAAPVQVALGFVAAGTIAASIFFRKIQYGPRKVAERAQGDEARAAGEFVTGHIISWALADSVAVYGLVLGFLGQSPNHFTPFGVAAILLFALSFPKTGPYEEAMRG